MRQVRERFAWGSARPFTNLLGDRIAQNIVLKHGQRNTCADNEGVTSTQIYVHSLYSRYSRKGNNSKQYSFDVNSVSNKVNKLHTSIGLTGVIKEALILSFLLIPGKTPAFDSFFCRHRCTTSVRLFDA